MFPNFNQPPAQYTMRFIDGLNQEIAEKGLPATLASAISLLPESLQNMPLMDSLKSFAQEFIERNCYKEIGQETWELFKIQLTRKSYEVYDAFCQKLKLYSSQFPTIFDDVAEIVDTKVYDPNDSTEKNFFNPINNQTQNVQYAQNVIQKQETITDTRHEIISHRAAYERIRGIIDLPALANDAMRALDVLFMEIY